MAKLLKLRRGTTSQHSSFTGAEGEVTVDTDKETLVVHDGSTAGGHPVAAEDMANVSSASIAGRLANDSIAVGKIAAGTLPSDVKIADANVSGNLTIATADINTGAVTTDKIAGANVTTAKIADNAITSAKINAGAVATADIANNAVTFGKLQNITEGRIVGRNNSTGTGDAQDLTPTEVRTILNVENGATADQSANEILTLIKTVDGSGSGLDADTLEGVEGANYVRSDTDDTLNGQYTISDSADEKLVLSGSNNPYIRWQEGTTNKAYIQWNANGYLDIVNTETSERIKIASGSNGLVFNEGGNDRTVWHAGNDGSGSGLDADTLDGVQGANYVRSDQGDTLYGAYTISDSANQKLLLRGSNNPYIRWQEGTTNKAYIQWDTGGEFLFVNEESGEQIRLGSGANGLKYKNGGSTYTVWHAGNDGSGSGLDADLLDGVSSGSFLRSDQSGGDSASTDISFSGGAGAVTISGNSDIRLTNGSWTGDHSCKIQHHSNRIYIQGGSSGHNFRNPSGGTVMSIDTSGNVVATANVTAYSDARFKTDIHTINDALGICGKLRGVSYKWIRDGKPSIGVIAQEIEEVIPEVVLNSHDLDPVTGESTEVKSVDYGKIVGVLINAINELKAEVDELKGGK